MSSPTVSLSFPTRLGTTLSARRIRNRCTRRKERFRLRRQPAKVPSYQPTCSLLKEKLFPGIARRWNVLYVCISYACCGGGRAAALRLALPLGAAAAGRHPRADGMTHGGGAAALSQRNAGADYYFQNHAQVQTSEVFSSPTGDNLLGSLNCGNRAQGSVSEVRGSGSRPRGLPAAPPGAGGDFYLQNHAQVSISEVSGPGSRPRGLPAAPAGAGGDF